MKLFICGYLPNGFLKIKDLIHLFVRYSDLIQISSKQFMTFYFIMKFLKSFDEILSIFGDWVRYNYK
jgi:hypothetical protein